MANLLSNAVKQIVIETAWLPRIVINDPLAPAPEPSAVSPVVKLLKPKVTVVTSFAQPFVSAPYGQPTQNWPLLRNLGIGLGIYAVGLSLFARKRRALRDVPASAVGDFVLPPRRASRSRSLPRKRRRSRK